MDQPSWSDIWSRRRLGVSGGSPLDQLLAADGFDMPTSVVTEEAWRTFVADVAELLEIGPDTSVYDVGCGAGAFLYPLQQIGCRVGGVDASAAQIAIARSVMPDGDWTHGDAAALDPGEPWDVVVSMGAFAYFPGHEYARGVLARMAAKATSSIAVLDVPDLADQDAALAHRRQAYGADAYDEKYKGLTHLAYGRGWFLRQLAETGVSAVQIGEQRIAGYGNGPFRFNVFGKV